MISIRIHISNPYSTEMKYSQINRMRLQQAITGVSQKFINKRKFENKKYLEICFMPQALCIYL